MPYILYMYIYDVIKLHASYGVTTVAEPFTTWVRVKFHDIFQWGGEKTLITNVELEYFHLKKTNLELVDIDCLI